MHALHSNQIKTQNPQSRLQLRTHAKQRVKLVLTMFRFTKLNQGNCEGYKPRSQIHDCPKGPARRRTPWIKTRLTESSSRRSLAPSTPRREGQTYKEGKA